MNIKRGVLDRSSSKGQVTIFIIVAIVLLFVSAGIFYLTKRSAVQSLEPELQAAIVTVPQVFQPIQSYTENCLYQVGKQGLLVLGQQGGYIYPDVLGDFSPSEPTESIGLNMDPAKIPYWWYNPEKNRDDKVSAASAKPKLFLKDDSQLSIEGQLIRFVNEKIDGCLQDYALFAEQGFTIPSLKGSPREVEVLVGEESVVLILKMDVDAAQGEAQTTFHSFGARIPLSLAHYYDVAEKIRTAQENYRFLEKQGMELISIYSKKDANSFAPISDASYEFISVLSWSESLLKSKFQGLLASYVPMLRFLGSSNFYYTIYPEGNLQLQRTTDNAVLPLTGAEDVEVSFDYFGWPIYFSTNSDADGIIRPDHQAVKWDVLNFAHQRYETHYDASYPVLVTIHDPYAFGGEGYDFFFALEANIRNNAPAEIDVVREYYPKKITPLACNTEQRRSALIKTVVVDSFTKEPLEKVKIGFTIPEQDECEIGVTDPQGAVESAYPTVYGGVINFVKPEYLTNYYPIDTYKFQSEPIAVGQAVSLPNGERQKAIELDRIKKMKVSVQVKELNKCITALQCKYTVSPSVGLSVLPFADIRCEELPEHCFSNQGNSLFTDEPLLQRAANGSLALMHNYYLGSNARPLRETEEVLLTLERVEGFQPKVIGDDFFATVSLKGIEEQEINLAPGKYKVTGIITNTQPLLIPQEERCMNYQILTIEKQQCFNVEESRLDRYVSGNVNWNTPSTYLIVTPDDLYGSSRLTLTLLAQDLSSVPSTIPSTQYECAGVLCLPGVGCLSQLAEVLFDACLKKDVPINGRVIEDLSIPGEIEKVSRRPEVRAALPVVFSST